MEMRAGDSLPFPYSPGDAAGVLFEYGQLIFREGRLCKISFNTEGLPRYLLRVYRLTELKSRLSSVS
jgi:hypothetical protein